MLLYDMSVFEFGERGGGGRILLYVMSVFDYGWCRVSSTHRLEIGTRAACVARVVHGWVERTLLVTSWQQV